MNPSAHIAQYGTRCWWWYQKTCCACSQGLIFNAHDVKMHIPCNHSMRVVVKRIACSFLKLTSITKKSLLGYCFNTSLLLYVMIYFKHLFWQTSKIYRFYTGYTIHIIGSPVSTVHTARLWPYLPFPIGSSKQKLNALDATLTSFGISTRT